MTCKMRRSFLVSAASASLIPNIFSITFVQQCRLSRLGEFILLTTMTFMCLFGQMEQSRLVRSFDQAGAFNLLQLVMPAKLVQPLFGVPMAIND